MWKFQTSNMFEPCKLNRWNMFKLIRSSRDTFTTYSDCDKTSLLWHHTHDRSFIYLSRISACSSLSLTLCCISCVMVVFALALGRAHFFILLPVLSNTGRTSITLWAITMRLTELQRPSNMESNLFVLEELLQAAGRLTYSQSDKHCCGTGLKWITELCLLLLG